MLCDYFRYWGKADPNYLGNPKWHPLVCHCLDVAAVAADWWDNSAVLRSRFRAAFAMSESEDQIVRAWVLFFIALHDLGKFDARFQLKAMDVLHEAWPELDPGNVAEPSRFDHGRWGYIWAVHELPALANAIDRYEYLDAWMPWLGAVTGHHGDLPHGGDAEGEYAEEYIMAHDRSARLAFVRILEELILTPVGLSIATPPPMCDAPAQAWLAGFCAVCDWIGSNTDVSPYVVFNSALRLDEYFTRRVREIFEGDWRTKFGLAREAHDYQGFAALIKPSESPRGVQVRMDDLPCGPGLTLIEAPTGSGKTEAALAYAWRLLAAGVADSIILALPTQATANAMLKRAEVFAGKAFVGVATNVVLAHGKSKLNPEFERLVASGSRHTVQGREEANVQCAAWLAQSRKRVFLGQVGVCTVDQVLLSVLPVRHKFVRGFGLNKAVLIVDEVHAYDAYMHGLLAEVLRRQRATGGSAILLSATLPAGVRTRLFDAWDVKSPAEAVYPVVWRTGEGVVQLVGVPAEQQPSRVEVLMECLCLPEANPDDGLLDRIVAAAEGGARVAVVANLVDVAQSLARRLRERTVLPVDLFHARYRFADRQATEQVTLDYYGRDAARDGGRILVATQVVEQSLDLDFDWMLTQICPVDLLFQRLGRLHRHERTRPRGCDVPRCTVMTVEGGDYGLHGLIYKNTRVLWRTEELLSATARVVFPRAYREWIDAVYQETEWENEPEAITRNYRDFSARQIAATCYAKQMITTPRKMFDDDDVSITVQTRDGEMSLTVLPVQKDGRLLDGASLDKLDERGQAAALDLNTIPVPHSWKGCLAGCDLDEDGRYRLVFAPDGVGGWVGRHGPMTFIYTKDFGLERRKDDGPAQ
jgi:CRISPR-associated endonuclease/helicase Cas3